MTRRINTADIIKSSLSMAQKRLRADIGAFIPAPAKRGAELKFYPKTLSDGDSLEGLKIMDGRFVLGSQNIDIGKNGNPWSVVTPSPAFARRLHGFSWLSHLSVLANSKPHIKDNAELPQKICKRAQELTDSWIAVYGKGNPFSWREDILVERIYSWLTNWQLFQSNNDIEAIQTIQTNLYQQIRRLRKFYKYTPAGLIRLKAACNLVMGAACFESGHDYHLDKALDQIDDEVEIQILPDGGHISRSPEACAKALEMLIVTENLLIQNGVKTSSEIRRAIDRLAPMPGFFKMYNGNLCSFNGGGISKARYLNNLVKNAGIKPKNFGYAPHTHYQRLEKNNTVLVIDVGDAPPRPFDTQAHLAPLAFEMSTPNGALIVNCGWNDRQAERWREPMRKTAAHSTLILDNKDAGMLLDKSWQKKLLGNAIMKNAQGVHYKRRESENGIWIEAYHNGYVEEYGLRHSRRIYMDLTGNDVRGEDILSVPVGNIPKRSDQISFAIRFHLHPNIKVTLARDEKSALILQPGKYGWHFRTDAALLKLEKSVYLAEGSRPKRAEQLVIYGMAYGDSDGRAKTNRVRWTLKRLGAIE